jgi:hypothetical protein
MSDLTLIEKITELAAQRFRSFGGGKAAFGNPVAHALASEEVMFAAGVDIQDVVRFVLNAQSKLTNKDDRDN